VILRLSPHVPPSNTITLFFKTLSVTYYPTSLYRSLFLYFFSFFRSSDLNLEFRKKVVHMSSNMAVLFMMNSFAIILLILALDISPFTVTVTYL